LRYDVKNFKQVSSSYLKLLISKQLFSTALNEEGYSYGINSPINLKTLQLEIHGSHESFQGQKTVHFHLIQILLQKEYKKVVKNQKTSAHFNTHC
jgi:hypothetical protein